MDLPTNWAQMSAAEQLFVVTNLERTVRGLPAFEGMSSALDQSSVSAASANTDPVPPAGFDASYWTSNWAGGVGSALESIYLWMYDDGPGSPNANCQGGDTSGCWGHRDDILASFSCSPCVLGAAVDSSSYDGEPSWAELMVDTSGAPALAFAWSQVSWASAFYDCRRNDGDCFSGLLARDSRRDRPQFRWGALLRLCHDAGWSKSRGHRSYP